MPTKPNKPETDKEAPIDADTLLKPKPEYQITLYLDGPISLPDGTFLRTLEYNVSTYFIEKLVTSIKEDGFKFNQNGYVVKVMPTYINYLTHILL